MDEYFVHELAKEFGLPKTLVEPETSVQVLNTLIDGNAFYDALQLRSQGITVDRVVELLATPITVKDLRKNLAAMQRLLQTTNPNVVADMYLGVVYGDPGMQERLDEVARLPPGELTDDHMVSLDEVGGREGHIIPNLLWGNYRNDPRQAKHFYEHLASRD